MMLSRGATVAAYQADVRDYARAADVVSLVQREIGTISILINNAGIKRDGAFSLMDPAAWHEVIEMEFAGCEVLSQALAVDRVGYGTVDPEGETVTIERR